MTISRLKHLLPILLFGTSAAFAQRHELALSLGGFTGGDRLFSGVALGGAYSYRLTNRLIGEGVASLYLEVPFAAGPLQNVKLKDPHATRDLATFFITPALRVKFTPDAAVSPFFSIGGGYALFEQSTLNQAGQPNDAPRTASHGAFMYGGGVDVRVWRFVSLRGEARDFYTGNPAFNVPLSGGQHSPVASAALVFRWR